MTGSENRVRVLSAADITALYETAANDIAGILGIARSDFATDSSGNATAVTSVVTVQSMVKPIYPLPSLDAAQPADPASGRFRATVFASSNILSGYLWENTTIADSVRGVDVGILRSTISSVVTYFWSSAATTKIGEIFQVAIDDPYYNQAVSANVSNTTHNPRCLIGVRLFSQYQQQSTGISYAT